MKRYVKVLPLILLILLAISCQKISEPISPVNQSETEKALLPSGTPIEGRYIVVLNDQDKSFKGGANQIQALEAVVSDHQIPSEKIYEKYSVAITGFVAELRDDELEALRKDERVKYIEQDKVITLPPISIEKRPGKGKGGGGSPQPQVTPWGITRVGGPISASGKTAWIIDTGVDLDHPDLNVDVARSVTFVERGKDANTPDDLNGHGTHVAGTVAAIDNAIDVVGVAAGATVVAVKVLDRRGSGNYSWVIAGVDYVAANGAPGDAANMSLGGPPSQALDDAVANAASKGIRFALAAGNDSDDANNYSPARVNGSNIFTISAIDNADVFAYFSNWGNPPVDFAAPGVSILSLWKGGGTNTISGTSMATPHVTGLLLVGPVKSDGTAINDPDGNADPIAHK